MFTSGTTGRSKGVIKQNAADYFSARGLLEVVSATAPSTSGTTAKGTVSGIGKATAVVVWLGRSCRSRSR